MYTGTAAEGPATRLCIGVATTEDTKGSWAGSCAVQLAAGYCCPLPSPYTGYWWVDSHTGSRRWSSLSLPVFSLARYGKLALRYRQSCARSAHTGRCLAEHMRFPAKGLP
jgi:hypothetical protein